MVWYEDIQQYEYAKLPDEIAKYPKLAVVKVYPSGKTQPGWGAKEFVENNERGLFDPQTNIAFAERNSFAYAIVMRSLPMVCVDIDGKNDGVRTARLLQLPRTLAERSKSGNGFHLFYRLPYATKTGDRGFAEIPDIVGLIPGVDIKGTGLVFHYPHQRWNNHPVLTIPPSLHDLLSNARDIKRTARVSRVGAANLDPDELVIVHDELKAKLMKSIPHGTRNRKLYAIGAEMMTVNYPHWDIVLFERGLELGLEADEITEIINNIEKYA